MFIYINVYGSTIYDCKIKYLDNIYLYMSSVESIDELKDLLLGLQIENKKTVKKILKDKGEPGTIENQYSFLKNFPTEKKKKENIIKFYSMDVDTSSKEELSDAVSSMEELQENLSKEYLIKLPDRKSSSSGRQTNFTAIRNSAIPPSPVLGTRKRKSESNLKSLSNLLGDSSDEGEVDNKEFTFRAKKSKQKGGRKTRKKRKRKSKKKRKKRRRKRTRRKMKTKRRR